MASTYLEKTYSQDADSKRILTVSAWVKRSGLGANQDVISAYRSSDGYQTDLIRFQSDDKLQFFSFATSDTTSQLTTNRLFRDTSAWYHIVTRVDTTQATASDRVRIYINGVQETSFSTETYPAQNYDLIPFGIGTGVVHDVGAVNGSNDFDGSMTHVHYCDGYSYAPTEFGEYDANGVWKIKTSPSVTYGTNGFFILKDGNSVTDQSGNSNNWTVASGTLTNTEDSPSNVFCTLNALVRTNASFSNGNLEIDQNGSTGHTIISTLGASSGKWYWECKLLNWNSSNSRPIIGVNTGRNSVTGTNEILGNSGDPDGIGYSLFLNNVYQNGSEIRTSAQMGGSVANNDIYMVALDLDNNKLYFGRNGTWLNSGDPESGATGTGAIGTISSTQTYFPATASNDASSNSIHNNDWQFNFGNGYFGTTAVSSAGTNASGIGIFEYDVPTGYTALSTKGLNE